MNRDMAGVQLIFQDIENSPALDAGKFEVENNRIRFECAGKFKAGFTVAGMDEFEQAFMA